MRIHGEVSLKIQIEDVPARPELLKLVPLNGRFDRIPGHHLPKERSDLVPLPHGLDPLDPIEVLLVLHLEQEHLPLQLVEPVLAGLDDAVVVGSSYGGLVALIAVLRARAAGRSVRGLVLCAPALELPEAPASEMELGPPDIPTTVIHGRRDEVVPIDWSRRFAARGGVSLREVDDDHGLAGSVEVIIDAVGQFWEG